MPKYIIEHMEAKLYKWCILEYRHASSIVGKENFMLTNITSQKEKVKGLGKVYSKSASKLKLKKACLLDPNATEKLTPKEARHFDYFIFGGILGDNPPRARTKELVSAMQGIERRNLGREQMSTDTAVLVTKTIRDGKRLEEIEFRDEIELHIRKGESVLLPYRYVLKDGKPVLAPGILEMLKKQKGF